MTVTGNRYCITCNMQIHSHVWARHLGSLKHRINRAEFRPHNYISSDEAFARFLRDTTLDDFSPEERMMLRDAAPRGGTK